MLHLDEASTPNNHCIYKLLQDGDAPNDEVHIMTFIAVVRKWAAALNAQIFSLNLKGNNL